MAKKKNDGQAQSTTVQPQYHQGCWIRDSSYESPTKDTTLKPAITVQKPLKSKPSKLRTKKSNSPPKAKAKPSAKQLNQKRTAVDSSPERPSESINIKNCSSNDEVQNFHSFAAEKLSTSQEAIQHDSNQNNLSNRTSEVRHVRQSTAEYEMMDPFELTKTPLTPLTPTIKRSCQVPKKVHIVNEDLNQRLDKIQKVKEEASQQEQRQINCYLNVLRQVQQQVIKQVNNVQSQLELEREQEQHIIAVQPSQRSHARSTLKSKVSKASKRHNASRLLLISQSNLSNISPINNGQPEDDEECDVVPDDDEPINQLIVQSFFKDIQSQQSLAHNHHQLSNFHQDLLSILDTLQTQSSVMESQSTQSQINDGLFQELEQFAVEVKRKQLSQEITHQAWQSEFAKLSLQNKQRAERVFDLEAQNNELQMSLNEQIFQNKKQSNELQGLGHLMVNYGYVEEQSSLSASVKSVIEENERIKSEIRALLHDQMKERIQSEQTQRQSMRELPDILNQKYNQVVQEYGKRMQIDTQSTFETLDQLQREVKNQRQRMVELIEERTGIENELGLVKAQKREIAALQKTGKRREAELEQEIETLNNANGALQQLLNQLKFKVQTADAVKFELQEQIGAMKQDLKQLDKDFEQKEQLMQQIQQELQQSQSEVNKVNEMKEQLQIEKAEIVHLLQIKCNFIQQVQERASFLNTDDQRIIYLEAIQKLSMHAIRQSDSIDQLTCENIRNLIDENTYELLDRTERKLNEATQENIELVRELAQVYQDQIVWVEQSEQLVQLLEAIQQKRDQQLVMAKVMRIDLNPYRLRIEAHRGIFEQKITLFDRKLQALSSYEPTVSQENPLKEEIYFKHQNNIELKTEELKLELDQQNTKLQLLEYEKDAYQQENQSLKQKLRQLKEQQNKQSSHYSSRNNFIEASASSPLKQSSSRDIKQTTNIQPKITTNNKEVNTDDLIAMLECQAFAIEEILFEE